MASTTSFPAARAQRPALGSAVATLRPPRKINRFRMFTYVVLSLAAIIYILPFVWMLSKSVMSYFESNTPALVPSQLHLENYSIALTERNFLQYFWNTVRIEVLTVVGQTVVALMAAYAFARMRFPGRDLLFALFLMTIFIPSTILLVPNLILVTNISRFFESLNPSLKWMN